MGSRERESLYDTESSLYPRLARDAPEGLEAGLFLNDHNKIVYATRSSSVTWSHPYCEVVSWFHP